MTLLQQLQSKIQKAKYPCGECEGIGTYTLHYANPSAPPGGKNSTEMHCTTCKGAERHTGKGETMEERFEREFGGFIQDIEMPKREALEFMQKEIAHERQRALQEQREAMVEVVEGIIQEERFAGAPYALNEVIKAIKNLE